MSKKSSSCYYHYHVVLAYYGGRQRKGWHRREVVVLAKSRAEAVAEAVKTLSSGNYIYLPPASGSQPSKKDAGRYFVVLSQGKYYVCLAKTANQAWAYVHHVAKAPTIPTVWNICVSRLSDEEEYLLEEESTRRREQEYVSKSSPDPWICEFCGFTDWSRLPDDDSGWECGNCGKLPLTDDEQLERLFQPVA